MRTRWLRLETLGAALVVVLGGCGDPTPTPRPTVPPIEFPTPAPSLALSLADLIRDRGESQLPSLLTGTPSPSPFALSWSDIESGKLLTGAQKSAFCEALDTPDLDDIVGSILWAGLNALSEKLRHRPLPEDGEKVLGIATTFAVKTCPTWEPKSAPAVTPEPPWYPPEYRQVVGNPSVVWRYRKASESPCGVTENRCLDVLVIARDGCPIILDVGATFLTDDGTFVEQVHDTATRVPAQEAVAMHFGTIHSAGTKLVVNSIFCA